MMKSVSKATALGVGILLTWLYGKQALPILTQRILRAQAVLIQESKASKWGKPLDVFGK